MGGLFIATAPHLPMRNRLIDADEVALPNGFVVPESRGLPVNQFLGAGTLALAVHETDAPFVQYVPLSVVARPGDYIQLNPHAELGFESPGFGMLVGQLEQDELDRIVEDGVALVKQASLTNYSLVGVSG
ncbi:hypothetical protein E6P97_01480 [Patescibacteria group bacterium]|nr:MAG: hypothetical protein E6P97_01480 [Patescibacteria group bacterium]